MKSKHKKLLCIPILLLLCTILLTGCSTEAEIIHKWKPLPTTPELVSMSPFWFSDGLTAEYKWEGNQYEIKVKGRINNTDTSIDHFISIEFYVFSLHTDMLTTNPREIANPQTHKENTYHMHFAPGKAFFEFELTIRVGTIEPNSMRLEIVWQP